MPNYVVESFRGGSVMVWGVITHDNKTDLVVIRDHMTVPMFKALWQSRSLTGNMDTLFSRRQCTSAYC